MMLCPPQRIPADFNKHIIYATGSFAMAVMSSAWVGALPMLSLCVLSMLCNTCQNNVSDNLWPLLHCA